MKEISREERLQMMLVLSEQVPAATSIFHKLYAIVLKYDLPKHVDREFVYDSLIAYFSSQEKYGQCSELKKCKADKDRKKTLQFNFAEISAEDLDDLKMLGYVVPDVITRQVLFNYY